MNVLAISAHPDDETLGCGGALLKHRESGDSVSWSIVTKPSTPTWTEDVICQKAQEVENVAYAYEMDGCFRLGFPATGLETVPLAEIIETIRDVISKVRPDTVYLLHGGDVHSDHRIVYSACMSVLKPFYMTQFGVRRVLSYETLSSTDAAPPFSSEQFVPTVYCDVSDYIDRKIEIMKLYESELQDFPSPRSPESIRALARYRGATIAVPYAEAFMLRRELA